MTQSTISIEMFPAGNGDAILITSNEFTALIDGGYTSTYRDHLRPRLQELNSQGRHLSKFIVTHIDADHITGAIAFLKENGPSRNPKIIEIEEVWFNSYRHLHFEAKERGNLKNIPEIPISGGLSSEEVGDPERTVSFRQGSTLGSQLLKYNYQWNTTFDYGPACSRGLDRIRVGPNTFITLLGPTDESLNKLSKKWLSDLRKRYPGKINEDKYFDDAFELLVEEIRQVEELQRLMFDFEREVSRSWDWVRDYQEKWEQEDTSVTNGSSISFLLEHYHRKLLFLADALPGQMATQLQKLNSGEEGPFRIDLLKVSHHGAFPNNSPELLGLIDSKYYLFSSDGTRHHHPHLQTLSSILRQSRRQTPSKLVFNYMQPERLNILENDEIQKQYAYQVIKPDPKSLHEDGYVALEL